DLLARARRALAGGLPVLTTRFPGGGLARPAGPRAAPGAGPRLRAPPRLRPLPAAPPAPGAVPDRGGRLVLRPQLASHPAGRLVAVADLPRPVRRLRSLPPRPGAGRRRGAALP